MLALTLMKCGEDLLTHHSESVTSGLQHENKSLRIAMLLVVDF